MGDQLIYKLHENPLVGAIHKKEDAKIFVKRDLKVAFILDTNIFDVKEMMDILRKKDVMVFIHFDLLDGISKNKYGFEYVKEYIKPDGIITTRADMIKRAKKNNMYVIQRLFLLDSINLKSGLKSVKDNKPDAVEILPGLIHKITDEIAQKINVPLIAGGLIKDKKDIYKALNAHALGISTSKKSLW